MYCLESRNKPTTPETEPLRLPITSYHFILALTKEHVRAVCPKTATTWALEQPTQAPLHFLTIVWVPKKEAFGFCVHIHRKV